MSGKIMTWKKCSNKYAFNFWNSPFIDIMGIVKILTISKKRKKIQTRNILDWPFKSSIRYLWFWKHNILFALQCVQFNSKYCGKDLKATKWKKCGVENNIGVFIYLRWKLLLYAPNPTTMLNSWIFVKERKMKLKLNIHVIEKEKSVHDNCNIFLFSRASFCCLILNPLLLSKCLTTRLSLMDSSWMSRLKPFETIAAELNEDCMGRTWWPSVIS